MNRSPVKKAPDPNRGLVVKGSGYTPSVQFKPPSSLAPKRSSVAFGLTTRKVRIQSQPPVSNLKRSGSVGSVLSNRVPLAPRSATSSSSGERGQLSEHQSLGRTRPLTVSAGSSQPVICNCQHPADLSFLEDVYVQNLQTQIEVLEIENSLLKKQSQSTLPPTSSYQTTMPSYSKPLIREETINTTGAPGASSWAHAAIPTSSTSRNGVTTSKHVEFRKRTETEEDELFSRLEESLQKEQKLEDRLKKQIAENRKLSAINEEAQTKLEEVTEELRQLEGKVTKERRNLMEDNVELQRRLDELTPLLAEKEAQIAKLLNEKEGLNSRLRTATTQLSALQNRVEEQKREESLMSEMDSERKQEIERLKNKIRQMEAEMDNFRVKENNYLEEITTLQRKLKEEELMSKKASTLHRKVIEDNEILIKENSTLSSQVNRLESIVQQHKSELNERRYSGRRESEVSELRQTEKTLRNEILRLEDRIRREQDVVRTLENQIKDREYTESESRTLLTRTQKELEGLEALSKSLTNENTGLREEKISLNERIEYLQRKLGEKELEIHELTADLDNFKRKYNEATSQLRKDMDIQSERSQELEEIVRKVHELSDSLPRRPRSRSRSSSVANRRQFAENRLTSSSVVSVESVSGSPTRRLSDRYRRTVKLD